MLLTFLWATPLLGSFLMHYQQNIRPLGVWLGLIVVLGSVIGLAHYSYSIGGLQYILIHPIIPDIGLEYAVGADPLSLIFIALTGLMVICVFLITPNISSFIGIAITVTTSLLILAFSAINLLLFAIVFEASLVPILFLIGRWGGEYRKRAALQFYCMTFLGQLCLLISILSIFSHTHTLFLPHINIAHLNAQTLIAIGLLIGFAIKLPIVPFHTWLPLAHVEAKTPISMLLSGIVLKLGGYGIYRFFLPICQKCIQDWQYILCGIGALSALYAAILACVQDDIKKCIAYISIAHMGIVFCGLCSGTHEGVYGAMIIMITHVFISASAFLSTGMLYDACGSRKISLLKVPFPGCMYALTLSLIAFPLSAAFVGEIYVFKSMYSLNIALAILSALSFVAIGICGLRLLSATYFRSSNKPYKGTVQLRILFLLILIPYLLFYILVGYNPMESLLCF